MKNFSKNKKLNNVLNYIFDELKELGYSEVRRYMKEYPNEIDYNLYQYGNLTIYNDDIEKIYRDAGYKANYNFVEIYKRQVGYVARQYMKIKDEIDYKQEHIEETLQNEFIQYIKEKEV